MKSNVEKNGNGLLIVLAVCILVIVGILFAKIIFDKNGKKYTGSIVGKYVYKSDSTTSTIILNQNGTCDIYTNYSVSVGCTYVRKEQEVILSYYNLTSQKDVEFAYDITPEGNLSIGKWSVHYKQ